MALIRGFSRVTETDIGGQDAQMPIPSHIRGHANLLPGYPVEFEVLRVKGTSRRPHVNLHTPEHPPIISPLEAVFLRGITLIDQEGIVLLPEALLEEANLHPDEVVELKVSGARGLHWLVAYNRGKHHFLGRGPGRAEKQWRTMPLEY